MFHSYVGISIVVAKRYSTVYQNDCPLRLIIMCLIQVAIRFPPFPPIPGSIFQSNWGGPGWIRWNQGFFGPHLLRTYPKWCWSRQFTSGTVYLQKIVQPHFPYLFQMFQSFYNMSSRSSIFFMLSIFLHSCSCCSIIIIVFHTFPYVYPHVP